MGVEAGFLGELQRAVEEALKQDCRWRQGARSNRRAALPIDWEELKTLKGGDVFPHGGRHETVEEGPMARHDKNLDRRAEAAAYLGVSGRSAGYKRGRHCGKQQFIIRA